MLSPAELKKRQFTKSLRGYSVTEVDEHFDFVIEKYTELYLRNDELEKQISRLETELQAVKENEEAIRRAMVSAQKEERKIIDEANDRADLITRTAKMNTDRILADFKVKIREERMTLYKLRRAVKEFKENSLRQYQLHLEFLNGISSDLSAKDPELELTEDDYANSLLEQMRLDLEDAGRQSDKDREEARNSPLRRAPQAPPQRPGDFPDDQKMRTAIFDSVRTGAKPSGRAARDQNASTKEIPNVKKKTNA